jgi:hypothetical protein
LARIKAALGDDAVVTPSLIAAHLPEAAFTWIPARTVTFPRGAATGGHLDAAPPSAAPPRAAPPRAAPPRAAAKPSPQATCATAPPPPLMRRLLPRPVPLPDRDRHQPGWGPDLGPRRGAIVRRFGPHRISGGWWVRTVERDYWYVETQRGDLLWIFYDRPRRRWFLHAEID